MGCAQDHGTCICATLQSPVHAKMILTGEEVQRFEKLRAYGYIQGLALAFGYAETPAFVSYETKAVVSEANYTSTSSLKLAKVVEISMTISGHANFAILFCIFSPVHLLTNPTREMQPLNVSEPTFKVYIVSKLPTPRLI